MNRAERRAAGRKDKVPTYSFTQESLGVQVAPMLKDAVEKAKAEAMNFTIEMCTAVMIMKLHDMFGFGINRIERLLNEVSKTYDCIEAGYVELNDIKQWCSDFGVVLHPTKEDYEQSIKEEE